MAQGTLRYWAGARAAAGTAQEAYDAGTLDAAIAGAATLHGEPLARVLAHCAFLVDGDPVGTRDPATVVLPAGGLIDILPPFAGG